MLQQLYFRMVLADHVEVRRSDSFGRNSDRFGHFRVDVKSDLQYLEQGNSEFNFLIFAS
jgi:hypothetical protein